MASYAAAIKDALGIESTIEKGKFGQFDVVVDGKTVVSRKGGILAKIFRKPWPSEAEVIEAIKSS